MAAPRPLGYNAAVERIRDDEFPQLKEAVYLDHAGMTLYSKSLMDQFTKDMTTNLFGNPHSASPSSQLSTSRIEDVRLRILQFFNADPTEFDLVFVANATAGVKLVADAFRALPGGFDYAYHQACHTSLIGIREEARNSLCVDTAAVTSVVSGERSLLQRATTTKTLFAYPAQSNMDGQRFPLSWSTQLHERDDSSQLYTLLDAAAFASTSPIDLSDGDAAPDFTVVSFYKLFGFPDLGGLIVRRQAESVFNSRRYFGGGTVDMVVCIKEQWHAPKSQFLHERLEDGTLPVHNIIALDAALDVHSRLFGSMDDIASHTSVLSKRLRDGLGQLRHENGTPVCRIYTQHSSEDGGPIVAFNICNSLGAWIGLTEFEKLATLKHFHIRTGGVCNPGGIADALGLEPWELKQNFSHGFRCGNESDIMAGKPIGVIRASVGAMSTLSDVDRFISFVDEFYRDDCVHHVLQATDPEPPVSQDLHVASIIIYPIKSCGGFSVSNHERWEVRPEGLAWDREWCLIHRGTGQALSQKRYPNMALIRPSLDFTLGRLLISYSGDMSGHEPMEISVPLSGDPSLFGSRGFRSRSSRVCGDEISAQAYTSDEVNNFFSQAIGVPCMLARFPPGGQGKSTRHSKAHLQKHQGGVASSTSFCAPPSPPDSDSERPPHRILLSNESPILTIHLASLRSLNKEIQKRGGKEVAASVFRANVVLDSQDSKSEIHSYSEDAWSSLQIGQQNFKMLGSCRRCHMVCINQETGEKNEEPFVTLAKTRRFDGKVFFGTHMVHVPSCQTLATREMQFPTIAVGDPVQVDG